MPAASVAAVNETAAASHPRTAIARIVRELDPLDDVERGHQAAVRDWIDSGAELYRVAPPDTPPMHLVS